MNNKSRLPEASKPPQNGTTTASAAPVAPQPPAAPKGKKVGVFFLPPEQRDLLREFVRNVPLPRHETDLVASVLDSLASGFVEVEAKTAPGA